MTEPVPIRKESSSTFLAENAVKPAMQERSRKRHQDLIDAGKELLRSKDFDDIPVSAIASTAGCAVGSFYNRFEDKDAFFTALQVHVLREIKESSAHWFEAQDWENQPVPELVGAVVNWMVPIFIEHRGLIRAAHRHTGKGTGDWLPMRSLGQEWTFKMGDALAPRLTHLPAPTARQDVLIAMQFMYGTLINCVINDLGVLKLADPVLPNALTRSFLGYLRVPDQAPGQ
jgi:AcrR family transcriptional regulator